MTDGERACSNRSAVRPVYRTTAAELSRCCSDLAGATRKPITSVRLVMGLRTLHPKQGGRCSFARAGITAIGPAPDESAMHPSGQGDRFDEVARVQ